jgi:hypothetical protein
MKTCVSDFEKNYLRFCHIVLRQGFLRTVLAELFLYIDTPGRYIFWSTDSGSKDEQKFWGFLKKLP